jgi:Right handed beta helix region
LPPSRRIPSHRRRTVPSRRLLAVLAAVIGTVTTGVVAATVHSPAASARTRPAIMVSASPDRSAAKNLDGATLSGAAAYVFVPVGSPVASVTFVLDPGTSQARTSTDAASPYDLAGTATDGTAKPLDLRSLGAGSHKLAVRLQDASGKMLGRGSAAFSVVLSSPTASSTPTSSPSPSTSPAPSATPSPTAAATTSATTNELVVDAAPGGIAAALLKVRDANRQGKAVRLTLHPTTYREPLILLPDGSATSAPITIDGQGAVLSGADVVGSWTAVGDGTYRAYWPYNLGNASDPWPTLSYDRVLLNREALFVGGRPYHVVDSATKLVPGTFLVDEANDRITARPRSGDSLTGAEVTVRKKTLQVDGRVNVTVRNLTLARGAGAVQETMAGASNSTNFTVENVTVRQAAAGGFSVGPGRGLTMRNVRFLDNGISAYGSYKESGILIENAELAGNNWRGAQVGFTGWAAGVKFGMTSNVTINGWNAHNNYSHGLWFDYDNRNVTVTGLVSAGNLGRGLFLEKNPGPIVVDSARICNNGMSGISYARSDRVTVQNSQVFNNAGWQHFQAGDANPVTMPDGTVVRGYWLTLRNNVTVGDDWPLRDSLNKGWLFWQARDDAGFWSSISLSGNTWYHTQRTNPFRVNSAWDDWYTYPGFASKARETTGRWASPGTLTCSAPRPTTTVDYAVGW